MINCGNKMQIQRKCLESSQVSNKLNSAYHYASYVQTRYLTLHLRFRVYIRNGAPRCESLHRATSKQISSCPKLRILINLNMSRVIMRLNGNRKFASPFCAVRVASYCSQSGCTRKIGRHPIYLMSYSKRLFTQCESLV